MDKIWTSHQFFLVEIIILNKQKTLQPLRL